MSLVYAQITFSLSCLKIMIQFDDEEEDSEREGSEEEDSEEEDSEEEQSEEENSEEEEISEFHNKFLEFLDVSLITLYSCFSANIILNLLNFCYLLV